jgi:pyruvate formate lyase activating enzyme
VPGEISFEEDVLPFLESRVGLLDAVVFSGGEPTLQSNDEDGGELLQAIRRVRAFIDKTTGKPAFKIGLHSAGAYTNRLKIILRELDWIGFDVKAPVGMYDKITNIKGSDLVGMRSLQTVLQEQEFRKNTDRPLSVTFRTTIDPTVMSNDDVKRLVKQLSEKGIDNLVLQDVRTIGSPADYPAKFAKATGQNIEEVMR